METRLTSRGDAEEKTQMRLDHKRKLIRLNKKHEIEIYVKKTEKTNKQTSEWVEQWLANIFKNIKTQYNNNISKIQR